MAKKSTAWAWEPKQAVYKNGLPFTELLAAFISEEVERVNRNFASMIVIDGGVGQGKTTLAVLFAEYINGGPIDYSKQLAIGGADFWDKIHLCYKHGLRVVIYDEAGDFSSRGALSKFNAFINRVFETYRAYRVVVILTLPLFASLDASILHKQIVRGVLHVHDRHENYTRVSAYDIEAMYYLKHYMSKMIVPPKAYSRVSPNFRAEFKDLPAHKRAALHELTVKGKVETGEAADIENRGLLNYADIARKVGKSVIYVRLKVKELRLKPVKVFRRKNYYGPEIVSRLLVTKK